MSYSSPLLIKTYDAETIVNSYRLVKPGTENGFMALATSATDSLIGIGDFLGAEMIGDRIEVIHLGIAELEVGAAVVAGALLTADAQGRGITASAGNRYGAIAIHEATAAGLIIPVLLTFGLA